MHKLPGVTFKRPRGVHNSWLPRTVGHFSPTLDSVAALLILPEEGRLQTERTLLAALLVRPSWARRVCPGRDANANRLSEGWSARVVALQTSTHYRSKREILPTHDRLRISLVLFSPLGKWFLTGAVDASTASTDGDVRTLIPRFTEENRTANQALVDLVTEVATAPRSPSPGCSRSARTSSPAAARAGCPASRRTSVRPCSTSPRRSHVPGGGRGPLRGCRGPLQQDHAEDEPNI